MKTFLLLFIALTSFAWAYGLPTVPYLYVEGHAAVEKKADLVSLAFVLDARDAAAAKANTAVQAQAAKIFALVKSAKIPDGDVTASGIQSDAEYEGGQDGGVRGKFLGYHVGREFVVKVRDLVKFPKLVNDLFAANVRYFRGATPEYSKAKEADEEAQEAAVDKARAEAEKLAKLAGMKVDSVWAISTAPFSSIEKQMLGEASREASFQVASGVAPDNKADMAPEYRFAPLQFTQSIQIIYLISPAK